jgi:hypothetical protein
VSTRTRLHGATSQKTAFFENESAWNGSTPVARIKDERHKNNWRTIIPSIMSCQFLAFYSGYCCGTNIAACRLGIIAESWQKDTTAKRPIHASTENPATGQLTTYQEERPNSHKISQLICKVLSVLKNRGQRKADYLYTGYQKKFPVNINFLYVTWAQFWIAEQLYQICSTFWFCIASMRAFI